MGDAFELVSYETEEVVGLRMTVLQPSGIRITSELVALLSVILGAHVREDGFSWFLFGECLKSSRCILDRAGRTLELVRRG
jgi:hypothetical protein